MKAILLQNQTFNANLCISCVPEFWLGLEESSEYFWQQVSCPDCPLPREAACRRQFPSPVVARGSRRLQLVHTVDHQLRRPGMEIPVTWGEEPATGADLCAGKHKEEG